MYFCQKPTWVALLKEIETDLFDFKDLRETTPEFSFIKIPSFLNSSLSKINLLSSIKSKSTLLPVAKQVKDKSRRVLFLLSYRPTELTYYYSIFRRKCQSLAAIRKRYLMTFLPFAIYKY